MDALSNLLHSVRLSGAAFLMGRFTQPWCLESCADSEILSALIPNARHLVLYHLILEGECQARLGDNSVPPLHLTPGDLLIVPRGDSHFMGDPPEAPPITDTSLLAGLRTGATTLLQVEHGGTGPAVRMMCGYLDVDKELSGPLIEALPRIFRVNLQGGAAADWIEASMRFAVSETAQRSPGSMALLAKLSESLFAEAVRRYSETVTGQQKGWLAGLHDPVVGRALALLHDRPADAWTVDELSRRVGVSRSLLAQRFTELVGHPPMRYLTQWRLRSAAQQLRASDRGVADIAGGVGYDSEAAFNRAFKRELGAPPAAWRKQARGVPA